MTFATNQVREMVYPCTTKSMIAHFIHYTRCHDPESLYRPVPEYFSNQVVRVIKIARERIHNQTTTKSIIHKLQP